MHEEVDRENDSWVLSMLSWFWRLPAAPPRTRRSITPGEALVVEGVPPIPASLAEEVGRYTEFRSANFTSWHPKLHEMIIATRFGNVNQAHLVKSPGRARGRS